MIETKARAPQQDEIAASLYSSLNRVAHRLRNVELPKGCTPERLRTLASVDAHGPISVTGLAEIERVRPATMSRMVASLEVDGLVKRRDDKNDRRGVLISTTSKGRQVCSRANQEYLKQIREAIVALDSDQAELLRDLAGLLEKLSVALDR